MTGRGEEFNFTSPQPYTDSGELKPAHLQNPLRFEPYGPNTLIYRDPK